MLVLVDLPFRTSANVALRPIEDKRPRLLASPRSSYRADTLIRIKTDSFTSSTGTGATALDPNNVGFCRKHGSKRLKHLPLYLF
eukprot:555273-Amphidinium_carterae.1